MNKNPFQFGKVVAGESFLNRSKEIREITSALERGQSVILFSPRRHGKTSLIMTVLERMRRKDMLVFSVDLYRITTMEEFCRHFSDEILASLKTPGEKLFSLVRTLIPALRPRLVYAETNAPSIELEIGLKALEKQATIQQILDFTDRYCAKTRKKACIVFDEFQEITTFDKNGRLEREMRACFQHHKNVSYAFLGSKLHLMSELFRDKNRPFYNFGQHIELGPINRAEWIPFIREQFRKTGILCTDVIAQSIVILTGGHPFCTQLVCSEAWELAHEHGVLTEELVRDAMLGATARESESFEELWDSLTLGERRLLAAMAREAVPVGVFAHSFLVKHNLGAVSAMQRIVVKLKARGVVDKKGAAFSLIDPLLAYWIRGDFADRNAV